MANTTVVSPAMALRIALYQAQPSPTLINMSDQDVMVLLAEKLLNGSLVLSTTRQGGWPTSTAASSAAASSATTAAVESAAVVNLNLLSDPPAVIPTLPALEEVQIEGAEVLPEVDQSLDQIGLAIGTMDGASVSLAPAPTKVPTITTAMTEASSAITKALDEM